jgi:hypothetical protein
VTVSRSPRLPALQTNRSYFLHLSRFIFFPFLHSPRLNLIRVARVSVEKIWQGLLHLDMLEIITQTSFMVYVTCGHSNSFLILTIPHSWDSDSLSSLMYTSFIVIACVRSKWDYQRRPFVYNKIPCTLRLDMSTRLQYIQVYDLLVPLLFSLHWAVLRFSSLRLDLVTIWRCPVQSETYMVRGTLIVRYKFIYKFRSIPLYLARKTQAGTSTIARLQVTQISCSYRQLVSTGL